MTDPEVFKEFEAWFNREKVGNDSDFAGETAQAILDWAEKNGCLEEVLTWSQTGRSFNESGSIRFAPNSDNSDPFPTVRRVGGDHDRGFSPALNAETGRRIHSDEE